jgi:hypothetical protein
VGSNPTRPAFSSLRNPGIYAQKSEVPEGSESDKFTFSSTRTLLNKNRTIIGRKKKLRAGGKKSRHKRLLEDPDVKRWYDNLARGSRNTAIVRLRRLGLFCEQNNTTPTGLVHIGKKDAKAA